MTLEAPLWIQLGTFASQNDRLLIDTLLAAGVLDGRADPVTVLPASGDLAATPNASSLAVDVAPGVCVVTGTDQTRQGKYVCRSTAIQTVALSPRPAAGQSRIDVIFAQVLDSSSGIVITPGTDGWIIDKVTGVPSGSSPAVPAAPTSSLILAQALVASTGGGTLLPGDITDRRVRALSRNSPIAKQWRATTAPATVDDFFAQAGLRSIPGAQIPIVTYTPNVPVTFHAHVGVAAIALNHAVAFTVELLQNGVTSVWSGPQSAAIVVTSAGLTAEGHFTYTYTIPAPGSYTARIVGQAYQSQNVTTKAAGSWLTAQWSDIAGPTG
jgi:hypothetical protein